jgi:cell wall assembly regulator SMI1
MAELKLVKITDWNPMGVRTKEWPKNRWRDEVINDLNRPKLRNWSQIIKEREAWNDLVQKTTTHVGLQCQKKKKKKKTLCIRWGVYVLKKFRVRSQPLKLTSIK